MRLKRDSTKRTGKFTALFLTATILISTFTGTAVFAADSTSDFTINDSGVLTKYNGVGGDVVIPNGVTGIGDDAFSDSAVTNVVIPDSVTYIGYSAFAS